MKAFRIKLHLLACAANVVCLSAGVHAQETTSAQAVDLPETAITDIVVTARRRAESQQSVPVAITAVTEQMLREKAIATPYDLTNSTPGIAATAGSAQRNDVLYFIRGQGATFGSSPSVVTYFADVPQQTNSASGGSNITFYDLGSVQVLKGPQGTLFGRSTTAGAVLLTPKAPSGDFDGFVEANLGNYNLREFTGAVNVPIVDDRIALRVAANYSYHDGYARSNTTGQDLDDRNRSSYRISLLVRPTDWFSNTAIFTDNNITENGTAAVLGNYEPNGLARLVVDPRIPGGSTVTGSLLDTRPGGILGLTTQDPAQAGGLGFISVAGLCGQITAAGSAAFANCLNSRLALINNVRASLDSEAARLAAGGSVRELATTRDNFLHSHVQQFINTTQIDFGRLGFLGETSFKNIFSATRNLQSTAIREIQGGVGSGVVYNVLNVTNPNCVGFTCTGPAQIDDYGGGKNKWGDVYSEEAQFSGQINDKHDWMIGYFTEVAKTNQYNNNPAVFQTLGGAFTVPSGLPGISTGYNRDYRKSQTGFFGQATIDFADFGLENVRFTGGYRHSIVKARLLAVNARIIPTTGIQPVPGDNGIPANLKQTADSYTLSLDWKIQPGILVYGTTRKGFKEGGINIQSIVPASNGVAAAVPYYGPETVTDYELGLKADYELGAVGMRTNLAVFQADYGGLQRASSFFNGQTTSNQIINAAKLRSRGIEIEQVIRLSSDFTVNANYAFLDSKFLSFPGVVVRPSDGAVIDRINTAISGAPRHKFDVAARYAYDAGDTGEFVLSGNVSYQSRYAHSDDSVFALSAEDQAPYAIGNLRLDWNNLMGNPVDLSIYAKNVFNKTFVIGSGNLISSQLGTTTYIYGDPRVVGVQLRARFGRSGER
ncbi:TonB-dependent receptor [Novosphingobium sp. CECT 9465]|uniref:TonB-dependent receptor n=1 Tax=Novosphingobium sp. CECT 9465 TaxID=2829794 RepID=UPI001E650AD6|nr:TonB-dependent receptor [Novosphingobium sp. CECT 9465]CAH0498090.1 Vitamin B12 transporter BtuB [Novosphingobium sp. CECT 9465]